MRVRHAHILPSETEVKPSFPVCKLIHQVTKNTIHEVRGCMDDRSQELWVQKPNMEVSIWEGFWVCRVLTIEIGFSDLLTAPWMTDPKNRGVSREPKWKQVWTREWSVIRSGSIEVIGNFIKVLCQERRKLTNWVTSSTPWEEKILNNHV